MSVSSAETRSAELEGELNSLAEDQPPGGLTRHEFLTWRQLYTPLLDVGYQLRDRYKPGWQPSWIEKGVDIETIREQHLEGDFEDAIPNDHFWHAMDATHTESGMQVFLKILDSASEDEPELVANRLLSSEPAVSDPRNHSLPVLAEIEVYTVRILVFPLYRPWFDPSLHLVAEIIPLVDRLLEGLCFLHDNNIAHGDIKCLNVLMNPNPMFPDGFNPLVVGRSGQPYTLKDPAPACTRLETRMDYVYIDFGACTVFESFEARRLIPYVGRGHTYVPPELRCAPDADIVESGTPGKLYDAFACDIWLLAKLFLDVGLFNTVPAMQPLMQAMYAPDPASRPTAGQCLDTFRAAVRNMAWGLLARVPNPIVTVYHTPESWSRYFMGPTRTEDAREYLCRMIEFLVMTDGAPRIEL